MLLTLKDGRQLEYSIITPKESIPKPSTLLLFHFTPGYFDCLTQKQKQLIPPHFQVILFSRSGFGNSTSHPEKSLQTVAEDVKELLTFLQITEPIYVMGYSGGGPFAVATAYALQSQIKKLILVCSLCSRTLPNSTNGMPLFYRFAFWLSGKSVKVTSFILKQMSKNVATKAKEIVFEDYKDSPEAIDFLTKNEDVLELFCNSAIQTYSNNHHKETAVEFYLYANDWKIPLEQITCPVAIFHGKKDPHCVPSMGENLQKSFPNSQIYWGVHHLMYFEEEHWNAIIAQLV